MGAILLPAAIAAGLPPISAGVAIAIAGQGMALSSDYVIQVAPGLSAKAAGVDTGAVADRAMVLSLITGGVALVLGYLMTRSEFRKPDAVLLERWEVRVGDGRVRAAPVAHPGAAAPPRPGGRDRYGGEGSVAVLDPGPGSGGGGTGDGGGDAMAREALSAMNGDDAPGADCPGGPRRSPRSSRPPSSASSAT